MPNIKNKSIGEITVTALFLLGINMAFLSKGTKE
jgi:hypothetical protein